MNDSVPEDAVVSAKKILVVDDDTDALQSTARILEREGYVITCAADGVSALQYLTTKRNTQNFDLILSDIRMPHLTGLELLQSIRRMEASAQFKESKTAPIPIPIILMTAYGSVEDAVAAMQMGAIDFLIKPFKRDALVQSVRKCLLGSTAKINAKKTAPPDSETKTPMAVGLEGELGTEFLDAEFFGVSESTKELLKMSEQVAPTAATVLITGESGTGKELIAKRLHRLSTRAKGPWVAINCAAIPESLLESELFGYEKGAFTGATQSKPGLFEVAHNGSLFLDEIGDMPLSLQAKLLRVIQEGEVTRLGSHQSRRLQVRLLCATHQDLRSLVSAGKFRADLLYRIEVIHLPLLPLRERKQDCLPIANRLLEKLNLKYGKKTFLSSEAEQLFLNYPWPGNVREMQNALERAVVLASRFELTPSDFPSHFSQGHELRPPHPIPGTNESISLTPAMTFENRIIQIPLEMSLKEIEYYMLKRALEITRGNKEEAAKILGIAPRTVYRRLQALENLSAERKA